MNLERRFLWQSLTGNAENATLFSSVPELHALEGLTERTEWHEDDPLQQSLRLREWVNRLPASIMETSILSGPSLRRVLNQVQDPNNSCHTTQALLAFSAVIHDVGKATTFRVRSDGSTHCPHHETVGDRLAPGICARFNFSTVETHFITSLVRSHGEPYELFKAGVDPSAQKQQFLRNRFEQKHVDLVVPLLLLAYGDLVTSHLGRNNPAKYGAIQKFYAKWLGVRLKLMTVDAWMEQRPADGRLPT